MCDGLKENLRTMVECFVEISKRGLKVDVNKRKVILKGEEFPGLQFKCAKALHEALPMLVFYG